MDTQTFRTHLDEWRDKEAELKELRKARDERDQIIKALKEKYGACFVLIVDCDGNIDWYSTVKSLGQWTNCG